MLVKDWMTPNPLTITAETPVLEALQILAAKHFRRLPVLKDGALVGMVTDKDLKDAMPSKATTLSVWELNYLLSKLTVGEVMAAPVYTINEDRYMEDAALAMQEHKVGGLPVLSRSGVLVGLITITDVLEAFTRIMGLKEGGTRVTIEMPDVPGSLNKTTAAIQPSNILSVATAGAENGYRRFVLRVVGNTETLAERLQQAGIKIVD